MSMRLEKGKPANVVTVAKSGGDYTSIQSAVDAAKGTILAHKAHCDWTDELGLNVADGDTVTITCYDGDGEVLSTKTYELDTDDTGVTEGNVEVDITDLFGSIFVPLKAAFDAQQGDYLRTYIDGAAVWTEAKLGSECAAISVEVGEENTFAFTREMSGDVRAWSEPDIEIQIYPGEYREAITLYRGIHLNGIGDVSIRNPVDGDNVPLVLLNGRSDMRGIKFYQFYDTSGEPETGNKAIAIFANKTPIDGMTVEDCEIYTSAFCMNWPVSARNVVIRRNKLQSANPLWCFSTKDSVITDNTTIWDWESSSCLAFADGWNDREASGMLVANNYFYGRRDTGGGAGMYNYFFHCGGYGHTFRGNTFIVESPSIETSGGSSQGLVAINAAELPAGGRDIVIRDNHFELRSVGNVTATEWWAVGGIVSGGRLPNVTLERNRWIVPTVASLDKIHLSQDDEVNTATVTVHTDGLAGVSEGAVDATNVTVN